MGGVEALSATDVQTQVKAALDGLKAGIDAKPEPNAYIVKTWKSVASWYRVYSDGFIEQGGKTTYPVNLGVHSLHNAFSSSSTYTIVGSYARTHGNADGFNNVTGLVIQPYTASTFRSASWSGSDSIEGYWYACGY